MATKTKTYEDYYNAYMQGIDTSAYDALASRYAESVDQDAAQQIEAANTAAQSQLKQAYITRMKDQRTLNDNLARAGIRGGATETANIKLDTNYGNTRGTINTNRANSINDINRTAAQSKLAYQLDIDAKKQAYIENRQAEARQAAREDVNNDTNRAIQAEQTEYERRIAKEQTKYDRSIQKDQIKYERQQTKRTQQIEKYTAKYSKYYSVKKLQSLLKKAKDPIQKQVINARIGYLKSPEYKASKKNAK